MSLCGSDREAAGTVVVFGVHRYGHGIQGQEWASRPRHAQIHHPLFFIQTLALMADRARIPFCHMSLPAACPHVSSCPWPGAPSLLRCLPLTASDEGTLSRFLCWTYSYLHYSVDVFHPPTTSSLLCFSFIFCLFLEMWAHRSRAMSLSLKLGVPESRAVFHSQTGVPSGQAASPASD